jgi:hypothetical protein
MPISSINWVANEMTPVPFDDRMTIKKAHGSAVGE